MAVKFLLNLFIGNLLFHSLGLNIRSDSCGFIEGSLKLLQICDFIAYLLGSVFGLKSLVDLDRVLFYYFLLFIVAKIVRGKEVEVVIVIFFYNSRCGMPAWLVIPYFFTDLSSLFVQV